MTGPLAASELAWMICAIFSLPAPLGPVISTGSSERATWQARAMTRSLAGSANTAPHRSYFSSSALRWRSSRLRRRSSSRRASDNSSRLLTVVSSLRSSHGLAR
ncbi:hypothetical protein G6F68_017397 [Rhizopus microsporus]|nr:hypothetical protein G6F68_017397 [Rhizopus microsporus]